MRIGVVVDGRSEFSALPKLKLQIEDISGNTIAEIVKADIHPMATAAVIARAAAERISVLQMRNVDCVVVLVDREDRPECPGALAEQIRERIQPRAPMPVAVVIKDRTFENWLVSDPDALLGMRARFAVSRGVVNSIRPNKADHIDAARALRVAARGHAYEKVKDAGRILERADVLRMAANSRSFRKFLRCVGHPAYATQSRAPIDTAP